ncbi:MAG: hypothetical protein OXC94_01765, partial [Chloroflexi bacterium]|nr:hypothetical protein [Chloroflexota bacterium]
RRHRAACWSLSRRRGRRASWRPAPAGRSAASRRGGGAGGGGPRRNVEQLGARVRVVPGLPPALVDLIYDPQTSGGLLVALAPEGAASLVAAGAGWTVGRVEAGAGVVEVR